MACATVESRTYDNARDLIRDFYAGRARVNNFQSDIYFTLTSPDFLKGIFTTGDVDTVQKGIINYLDSAPNFYQIILKQRDGGELRFLSNNGFDYQVVRINPLGELIGFGAVTGQARRTSVTITRTPLAFVFPYQSFRILPGEKFELEQSELVYSQPCYVLKVKSKYRGDHKIWLNQNHLYVMRIDWIDPADGKLVRALYHDFTPVKGKDFWLPTYLEVTKERAPLYYVEMTAQAASVPLQDLIGYDFAPPEKVEIPTPIRKEGKWITYVKDPVTGKYVEEEKFGETSPFTPLQVIITLLMGGGLIYLIGRLIIDLTSREIFSRELMVVDSKKGNFIEKLKMAGLPVTAFTPEKLTEERKIVGTRRGKQQPRALLIAPDSVGTIKDYFFLLRAYLDEGGRVLILPQSKEEREKLPFEVVTTRYNPELEGFLVYSRMKIWKKTLQSEVENMLTPHLANEMILTVDEAPMDKEILVLHNKRMGIKGSIAGVVKQGKGEILFLQMNLEDLAEMTEKSVLHRALEDILNYFQNRPSENNR
ncbi:MAG: hypothetical protein J7M18_03960 [Candidatus Eremiobacteraeota bacterium]|nr:hypothetical protein [Candidatus Eremiobacteraeota bacterium]